MHHNLKIKRRSVCVGRKRKWLYVPLFPILTPVTPMVSIYGLITVKPGDAVLMARFVSKTTIVGPFTIEVAGLAPGPLFFLGEISSCHDLFIPPQESAGPCVGKRKGRSPYISGSSVPYCL